MPDTPPTTLIHFSPTAQTGGRAVCGTLAPTDNELAGITARHGMVTCFACRRTPEFKAAQHEPLPQRHAPARIIPPYEPTPCEPIKLSGVMQQHPVMAELYAEAVKRGEPVPQYLHDCSDCEYLGSTLRNGANNTIKRVELYWCHAPEEGNVLARYSDSPGDYHSGLGAAQHDPDLALAVVRAIHKGLVKANALHFL